MSQTGIKYVVTGPSPVAADRVRAKYRGALIDGREFDSSDRHGESVSVRASLAYGNRSYSGIPPNSALAFELQLLSIDDASARVFTR